MDLHLGFRKYGSISRMKLFQILIFLWAVLVSFISHGNELTPKSNDLITPQMTEQEPAAGRRVRQVALEYQNTDVYHALYLPTDWHAEGKYPVIIEYTGNKFSQSGSSGEVKDANLGYGMSGGKGFIWVSMPYVAKDKKQNATTWWGDIDATIDYCKINVPRICQQFGGDSENVVICGFSRGAIATSYIGLADDEIAKLWKGIFAHDHFDGQREWQYPNSDRAAAMKRLERLQGRPVWAGGSANDFLKQQLHLGDFTIVKIPVAKIFSIPDGKVIHPHTDLWMHRDSQYRDRARQWLQQVVAK